MDHWICFLGFLRVAFCLTNASYILHSKEAAFDQAVDTCQHNGFLTDMAEEGEVAKIISAIEDTTTHMSTLQFWVGLRKSKLDCVLYDQPLKGFKWTVNNSSDTKVSQWKVKPPETCTSVLCGLLTVEYNEKKVTNWGWNGSSCKEKHPFICRINKQVAEIKPPVPECDTPYILEVLELLSVEDNPLLRKVHCVSGETFTLTCSPGNKEWTLGSGPGEITHICLACTPGYTKNDMGSCIDIDECANRPPCESGCTNTQGSYKCDCDAAMGYVPGEDSTSCKKLPMPTDAPASSTTIHFLPLTNPSPQATHEKASLPTVPPGPSTTTGASVILEAPETQSTIWIPVLAAVLSLVFLVVIILIIVKSCLRKRSKNLSREKGGKSKETVVLKAADSVEDVNQKEIV